MRILWFAHGGGVKAGPFKTQVEAWEAMVYTDKMQKWTGYKHPLDTHVWPERATKGRGK